MTNDLQVFTYNSNEVRTVEKDGEVWFVAKDVCDILEYANTSKAIADHLDDDEKGITKCYTPGGEQNMTIISESGFYALVLRSNKPGAKAFSRWVRKEVLPQIRKTGSFSVNNSELEIRRKDLDLKGAQILQSLIDKELFPVTPETRTVFAHEVFKLVTGHEYLGMLPESTEKWYTATDIGAELGLSANKIGRIAKANGIKAPEGESNEFGRWIFSKSKFSNREVPSFIYSEAGFDWFRNYIKETA